MFRLATVSALAAGAMMIGGRAQAAALPGSDGLRAAIDTSALTENVQYFFGGRNYCWYDLGWNGPGWYWCGYGARRGFGWGGGYGYRGWGGGGRRGGVVVRGGGGRTVIRGGGGGGRTVIRGGGGGAGRAAIRGGGGGGRGGGGGGRGHR
jgi:hypothetical protein